ncbi:hypothetical protein FACS189419_02390 [Planctomycetales bacterium]|nr:hypothetical protein FACS189419_02390 [Planctomycetales bacterium]
MDTNRQELRIGIMVLAAIVSLVLMTVFFSKQSVLKFGSDYTVQVRFQRAPGIKRNAPVFKNGVQIGQVYKVELVDLDREVEITLMLDKARKIYTNEECRIRQSFVMGDTSLDFTKIPSYSGKIEEIDPSIPLVGNSSGDIMSGFNNVEGDLTKAIQGVAGAAEKIDGFIGRINLVLGTPEEFQERRAKLEELFNESRNTIISFRQMTDGINQYANDPQMRQNVKKIVDNMPEMLDRSRTLVGESTLFIKDARSLVERGNVSLDKLSGSIDTLAKLSQQIGGDAPEVVASLKKTMAKLSSFFEELTMVVENARNSDGTLKRLMQDPAAYEKILATLDNIENLTGEADKMLRVDVKPITNNVKILTDKAARDPAIFIRNLLQKEPPTKNLPYWGDGLGSDGVCVEDCSMPCVVQTAAVRPCRLLPFLHIKKPGQQIPVQYETLPVIEEMPAETMPVEGEIIFGGGEEVRNEAIPAEGRIVNADPRYPELNQPAIRQASWKTYR